MQQSQESMMSNNQRTKPPLEEKFVHLYKEIFSGCSLIHSRKDSGIQGQAALTRFWDELLLLKVSGFIFPGIMPVMAERIIYLLILALSIGLLIYHKYPSVRWCSFGSHSLLQVSYNLKSNFSLYLNQALYCCIIRKLINKLLKYVLLIICLIFLAQFVNLFNHFAYYFLHTAKYKRLC